jgi:hypothetical protein
MLGGLEILNQWQKTGGQSLKPNGPKEVRHLDLRSVMRLV